ncbi:MAG: hypothetical protein GY746_18590 [Gammaproteobacteria bacterium]|nr:hypothetical protein [Gammaproteobacteria bacterium]
MDRRKFLVSSAGIGAVSLAAPGLASAACPEGTDAQIVVLRSLQIADKDENLRTKYPQTDDETSNNLIAVDKKFPPGTPDRY